MKIILLLLTIVAAAVFSAVDILRVNNRDGTWQDFEISNITRLTFVDCDPGDLLRVNYNDESRNDYSLDNTDKLRFSDWYGYLATPQNLNILADSSSVILNWDSVSGATEYLIYRSETDPYTGYAKIDSTSTVSYQDNGVLSGNKYFYIIKARNSQ